MKTVETLLNWGHDVLHVPKLNARLFLAPGHFASLGSQYPATKSKNKEINAVFHDESGCELAMDLVRPWIEAAQPVSFAKLAFMINCVTSAKPLFIAANTSAQELQSRFDERFAVSTAAEGVAKASHIAPSHEDLQTLYRQLGNLRYASQTIKCSVVAEPTWENSIRRVFKHKLVPTESCSLVDWNIDGQRMLLGPLYRYLSILDNDGSIGWARLAKTRITYIHSALTSNESILLQNEYYKLSFNASRGNAIRRNGNVSISILDDAGTPLAVAHSWYSPQSLKILDVTPASEAVDMQRFQRLSSLISNEHDKFIRHVRREMTNPFRYQRALIGGRADIFFGTSGTDVDLRLAKSGSDLIIVAHRR